MVKSDRDEPMDTQVKEWDVKESLAALASLRNELYQFIAENGGYYIHSTGGYLWHVIQQGRAEDNKGMLLWKEDFRSEREAYRAVLNRIAGNPNPEPFQEKRTREIAREEAQKAAQAAINGLSAGLQKVGRH